MNPGLLDSALVDSAQSGAPVPASMTATPVASTASAYSDTVAVILVPPKRDHTVFQTWFVPLDHPLVVAVAVFFLGRWTEQWVRNRRNQREYEAWLRVVADEVRRNLRLLAQTDAYLWVGIIPSYSLALFAPSHAFRELSLLSRSHTLLSELFGLYYEYQHIQDRLSELGDLKRVRNSAAGQPKSTSVSGIGRDPLPDLMEAVRVLARNSVPASFALHTKLAVASRVQTLPTDHLAALHREFQRASEVRNAAAAARGPLPEYEP